MREEERGKEGERDSVLDPSFNDVVLRDRAISGQIDRDQAGQAPTSGAVAAAGGVVHHLSVGGCVCLEKTVFINGRRCSSGMVGAGLVSGLFAKRCGLSMLMLMISSQQLLQQKRHSHRSPMQCIQCH